MDDRLKGAKTFGYEIQSIAISEDGNIGIKPLEAGAVIFNIKDVTEYSIVVDDTKNIVGGIVKGALIGGAVGFLVNIFLSVGKSPLLPRSFNWIAMFGVGCGALLGYRSVANRINSINLVFKVNNFNNPIISVPLLTGGAKINSERYNRTQLEIQKITAALDFLRNREKK
jgi:hypothetical protein